MIIRINIPDLKEGDSMKFRKLVVSAFACIIIISLYAMPYAADFIEPSKKEKCPVCGMKPHKFPKWVAEIIFHDGTHVVFDGPKDMFKFYFDISRYSKDKTKDGIADIYVTEYYTTERVRAEDVFFIRGSDVYGPMGLELIPLRGEKAAATFMNDHGGTQMLKFGEVKPHDIPGLHKHK